MTNSDFVSAYFHQQSQVMSQLPVTKVVEIIQLFQSALDRESQIFVCGNGGSAANASHFITDLSKGASDKLGRRFRGMSLTDNMPWITALGNDYAYEAIFERQLMNFAQAGDLLLVMSVSGNSPNLLRAVEWANANGLTTIALLGSQRGRLDALAQVSCVVEDGHYGRVEDAHMGICHAICYAFMDNYPSK